MDLVSIDAPNDEEEIFIFNPLHHDFTHSWLGVPYTIKSYEGAKFKKKIADHLAKHMKDEMVGKLTGVVTEKEIEEAYKQIYV